MKNISVEVINQRKKKIKGILYVEGKITIDDFWETFYISLDWWTQEDYECQWKEGLERIETHDTSCLVTTIYDPKKRKFIDWWLLYKEGNTIYIQNQIMLEEIYQELIGDKIFNRDTCYNFIEPRKPKLLADDGYEISEWVVELD